MRATYRDRAGPHGLTTRQAELIRAVYDYLVERGRPPSLEELAALLGVSKSLISQHLSRLAEMGWVTMTAQQSRTLSLRGVRMAPTFEGQDGCRLRSLLGMEVPHFEEMQESATLRRDLEEARAVARSLADRVAAQSELLSRRAEGGNHD